MHSDRRPRLHGARPRGRRVDPLSFGDSRTRGATERLFDACGIVPHRIMEFHTREMIREAVARDLGMSFMFERECPPDARLAVLPIASDDPATRIAGCIACRTERRRHPAIRAALEIAASFAG